MNDPQPEGHVASHIERRKFLATLLGGAAAAWPLAASAQQRDRVRRVGVLMNLAAGDPEGEARSAAFLQALQQLGWTDGHDVRIDYRWAGDAGSFHRYAEELLALAPESFWPRPPQAFKHCSS
jgi:putative tryptophan/tyrosine transport system substrate-binding protein